MSYLYNEKWRKENQLKEVKYALTCLKNRKLQVHRNIGSRHHKTNENQYYLFKFLRWSLMILIIQSFWTIVARCWAFVSVVVGECYSEYSFVCFGAKPTERGLAREISYESGRGREKARYQGRTEESSQQKKAVDRSREKPTVRERRVLGRVDPEAEMANVSRWVSIPGGCVGISLEYTLAIAHRCSENYTKVSQTSPFLCLELTQVRVCSFFSPSRLSMLCFVCL